MFLVNTKVERVVDHLFVCRCKETQADEAASFSLWSVCWQTHCQESLSLPEIDEENNTRRTKTDKLLVSHLQKAAEETRRTRIPWNMQTN